MTTPQDIEQSRAECREAFEFELIDNHMYVPSDMTRTGDFYADDELQFAWECAWATWQVARSTPAQPVDLPEPDASVYTMEALVPGGRAVSHVSLQRSFPAGTLLYAEDTVRRLLEGAR